MFENIRQVCFITVYILVLVKDLEIISSCLHYCNSLYVRTSQPVSARLWLVQNRAARPLTGTKKIHHISPVLASLHLLPVQNDFKILPFVFKVLHGLTPDYISLQAPHSLFHLQTLKICYFSLLHTHLKSSPLNQIIHICVYFNVLFHLCVLLYYIYDFLLLQTSII